MIEEQNIDLSHYCRIVRDKSSTTFHFVLPPLLKTVNAFSFVRGANMRFLALQFSVIIYMICPMSVQTGQCYVFKKKCLLFFSYETLTAFFIPTEKAFGNEILIYFLYRFIQFVIFVYFWGLLVFYQFVVNIHMLICLWNQRYVSSQ